METENTNEYLIQNTGNSLCLSLYWTGGETKIETSGISLELNECDAEDDAQIFIFKNVKKSLTSEKKEGNLKNKRQNQI